MFGLVSSVMYRKLLPMCWDFFSPYYVGLSCHRVGIGVLRNMLGLIAFVLGLVFYVVCWD